MTAHNLEVPRPAAAVFELPLAFLAVPVCVTAILWATRTSDVTPAGVLFAFLLLLIPSGSFFSWRQQRRGGLPVFALIGFAYWVFFAVGYFWLDRTLDGRYGVTAFDNADGALWLAVVGVVCIGLGMQVPLPKPARQLDIDNHTASWSYVQAILVLGTMASVFPTSAGVLGTQGRQIMSILLSTVPTVALLLVLQRYLEGRGTQLDRVLIWVCLPFRLLVHLASGWTGATVHLVLISAAMYLLIRRKVPWVVLALCVPAIMFLQVGKKDYRAAYWGEDAEGGIVDRAAFWVKTSASLWSGALGSGDRDSVHGLSTVTVERTSLLPQVAHVLDMTPSQVPFQNGVTYSYMAVALIPRFLWPDKPDINEANRYYQLTFGLSTANDVNGVNIGAGCLSEAYLNFGWPGVVVIMFGIGVVLGVYQRAFVAKDSSTVFLALGLALLPQVMVIESQMAVYLGGVIQTIVLTMAVFFPAVRISSRRGL
jgi:hypothetical protein